MKFARDDAFPQFRERAFFIHFFGADGTGKTTQGRMLSKYMKKKGIKNKLVRIRSGRTLASILYEFFKKFDSNLVELGGDGRVIRINSLRTSFDKKIWCSIEFLSILPMLLRSVFIPMALGKIIIAERYMIDAVATIAYIINDPSWSEHFLAKLLLKFIPRNSIFILLDANYKDIAERKGSSVDPKEYIEFQRRTYIAFAKTTDAVIIDTSTRSPVETHNVICTYLKI